jgi:homoserine dehydrogenase
VPLQDAVREAQRRGLAESDASEDLSGRDSARKLRILARHAFGREVDEMLVVGLTDESLKRARIETRDHERFRLIGTARLNGGQIQGRVRLDWIGENHPLAKIRGDWNALAITLVNGETTLVTGRGAGRWPTTEAVIADLFRVRRQRLKNGHPRESGP